MSSTLIKFFVNDRIFSGWTTVSVTRKVNGLVSLFNATVTNKFSYVQDPVEFRENQSIKITLGDLPCFDGFVENISLNVDANQRSIVLSGRSKSLDIVDCSYIGPTQYKAVNFANFIQDIIRPFGIIAKFRSAPPVKIDVDIAQAETVGRVIDRLIREQKLIVFPDFDGNLIFDINRKVNSNARIFEGINLLGGSVNRDINKRFSDYILKAQVRRIEGSKGENTNQNKIESIKDEGIDRYRPMVVVTDNSSGSASIRNRAIYEKDKRISESQTFTVKVQGFCKPNGNLWNINELVELRSNSLDYNGQLLIDSVVFRKTNSGNITEMDLINPDAYDFRDLPKKRTQRMVEGI